MKKKYDPKPITSNDELIDVVKSSIEEICRKFPLRIHSISVSIVPLKKDSVNEIVEPIEI